ncbi:MAG TPA: hypothetical protein VN673_05865 [Clostridia bacterium]|nr:hypothetical protein [Clostridia bacterium]
MNRLDWTGGLEQAWAGFVTFLPKLVAAVIVLVIGYYVARLLCRLLDAGLERVGFDRLVERGGIKKVLSKTKYDASDLVTKLVFYSIMLFLFQLAFSFFGPNPVSALLTSVIAFLPNIFVAVLIIIVASAVASAVKDILQALMAGLSYGRFLATLAATAIVITGVFAALNQINIAPAIVNGLFYAMLAVVVGSAIVAVGGGGILPMRAQWEKMMTRIERESPFVTQRGKNIAEVTEQRSETWKEEAAQSAQPKPDVRSFPQ